MPIDEIELELESNEIDIELSLNNEQQLEEEFDPMTTIFYDNHASLRNLDFEHSGHTGFASSAQLQQVSNSLSSHTSNTNNPHSVTKTQVGLGDVENKPMDTTPTENSSNYVTSGGVKTYVDAYGGKIDKIFLNTVEQVITNKSVYLSITKSTVGLSNVENKSSATIRSEIVASDIPNLDASKITTGTFSDSRIASAQTWNAKQNALNTNQMAAVNSGITSNKVNTYDGYATSKQNTLASQTAYTSKGSSTKVAQITTNSLGQVTNITEVDIAKTTLSDLGITATAQELNYVNGVTSGIQVQLNNKQGSLSSAQLNACNSGITSTLVGKISTNESAISTIQSKIPQQATDQNQLADKAFVNSSIENMAAFYVTKRTGTGTAEDPYQYVPFATKAELLTITTVYINGVAKTPGMNDFAVVLADESKQGTSIIAPSTKYRYPKSNTEPYDPTCWEYLYPINNTAFTQAQMNAINSGITSSLVAEISLNTSARHSHSNKALLDTYTQTEANLSDAVSKKHSHSNKTVLDEITSEKITSWDGKPSINATNDYVPYRSGAATFANSTLMYNSNAMAFTGKLHIGSSSPASYYTKGKLTIYDNTPSTQVTSLALLNYGGGGGCGVAIDMYNTSANSGIPSGRIGIIDNNSFSAYMELACKKSGAQSNPLLPICTLTPIPSSGVSTVTMGVGGDYKGRAVLDVKRNDTTFMPCSTENKLTGSGTTYRTTVASSTGHRLMAWLTYSVGDMLSTSSTGSNPVYITNITEYSSYQLEITTSATLGTLSSSIVYFKKAFFKVQDGDNSVKMFVNPDGKMGIGTVTPNYDLDVNGTINASTDIKINGVSVANTATQSANGLMSSSDKTKLDGIQSGAEVNVQSDWNQTDNTADDFIKNKPTIPSGNDLVSAQDRINWNAKSSVFASTSGTSSTEAKFLTIDNIEWKLGGGSEVIFRDWS